MAKQTPAEQGEQAAAFEARGYRNGQKKAEEIGADEPRLRFAFRQAISTAERMERRPRNGTAPFYYAQARAIRDYAEEQGLF